MLFRSAFQLPEAITEEGKNTVSLYEATLAISFIIYFGVTAAIIYAVFRFKRKPGDGLPVQVHGSSTAEMPSMTRFGRSGGIFKLGESARAREASGDTASASARDREQCHELQQCQRVGTRRGDIGGNWQWHSGRDV